MGDRHHHHHHSASPTSSHEGQYDDEHEIVYYDDGIGAEEEGGSNSNSNTDGGTSRLLRWTFSQSQASQLSQHQSPSTAAAKAPTVTATATAATGTTQVIPRTERRRRSYDRDINNDAGNEIDSQGSSSEDSDDEHQTGGKLRRGKNDNGEEKEEEDSEDPFASLQSYIDNREEETGGGNDGDDDDEDTSPPAAADVESPQEAPYYPEEEEKEEKERDEFLLPTYSPPPSCPDAGRSRGRPSHRHELPNDAERNYILSNDGEEGCGIDMKVLRRQSLKRKHQEQQKTEATAATKRQALVLHDDRMDVTNAGNEEVLMAARRSKKKKNKKKKAPRTPTSTGTGRSSSSSARKGRESNVGVKKEKSSIVGSRPMHWGAGAVAGKTSAKKRQQHQQARETSKKKKLSEAMRIRSSIDRSAKLRRRSGEASRRKSHTPRPSSRDEAAPPAASSSRPRGDNDDTADRSPERADSKPTYTSPESSSTSPKWEQNVNLREVQYKPAFIGRPCGTSQEIQEEASSPPNGILRQQGLPSNNLSPLRFNLDGEAKPANSNIASSICSTPGRHSARRSRKRGKAGTLLTALREIRSASQSDCMGLNSGANPHRDLTKRRRTTDMSDPRNRASSTIDVTLLADSTPWEGGIKRTTILGYVHSIQVKQNTAAIALPKAEALAWICLDYETVNAQRVARGTQLRIYDPMTIPSAQPDDSTPSLLPVITCTKVCEVYPGGLPPLSAIPNFEGSPIAA